MDYRLYFLDDKAHIVRALELECADDDEASQASEQHRDGLDLELWQRGRLVKKLPKIHGDSGLAARVAPRGPPD